MPTVPDVPPRPRPGRAGPTADDARLWAGALLLALLALTALAAVTAARLVEAREDELLRGRANAAAEAVERRILAYTEVLHGARGLMAVEDDVSRRRYHDYVATLGVARRYPGVQVIAFARHVPGPRLQAYEQGVRAQPATPGLAYPRFAVRPPGLRERHVVIELIEPQRGNEAALGFDLLSEPVRRGAVERARETGEAAATPPVTLVQETGAQRGFLIMLPVYRGGGEPASPAARRAAFLGVQYAAFRMGDLMRGVLGEATEDVELEVYDVGPAGRPRPATLDAATRTYATSEDGLRGATERRLVDLGVAGRRWTIAYAEPGRVAAGVERAVPWVIAASGAAIAALASWLLLTLAGSRRRALALAEDMTRELRGSRDELARRARELERSNRDLEQFATVASHDLKTPLRSVKAYVDLVRRRYGGRLDEEADEYLAFAADGATSMQALIDDLLAYASLAEPAAHVPVDLDLVLARTLEALRPTVEAVGAEVVHEPLPTVDGDERQLGQLLGNLLTNALTFSRPGRPPVVHVRATREPVGWAVEVADQGIGLDPAHAERIFGMFHRLHAREDYPGTGIGLAICRRVVENHGGTIVAFPNADGGTTFRFTLPAPAEAAQPVGD